MKNTESYSVVGGAAAAIVIVLLAGVGGHLKGKADRLVAARSAESSRSDSETAGTSESATGKSGTSDARRLEKIQKRLLEIWKSDTLNGYDPEVQAQTSHLLEQMSSPEIEAFLRSLPPGAERRSFQMVRSILFAWGLQDGPAALAYLGSCDSSSLTRINTTQMVMSWAQDQTDAAFAWMNEGALTPLQKSRVANIRLNSLMTLLESDPDRAFQEVAKLQGKDVTSQLRLWAGLNAKNPEMRKRLLDYAAATGNPEDLATVRKSVIGSLAESDPKAAKELMQSLQASGEELAALDAAYTAGVGTKNPQTAYADWIQRNAGTTEIPPAIQFGISKWMGVEGGESKAAIQWLDALPAGGQRDALYENSIPAMAGSYHFDEAAGLASKIDSPSLRADALNALQIRWLLANPEKAAEWKSTLSPEDQALLRK